MPTHASLRLSSLALLGALAHCASGGDRSTRPSPIPRNATPTPEAPIDAGSDAGSDADVTAAPETAAPVPPSPITQLALGHQRACALRADGRVVCWGPGCCADGAGAPAAPTLVRGLTDAVQIAGDIGRWCARRRDGEVRCWGDALRAGPPLATGAVEVSTYCARFADGSVSCMGIDGTEAFVAVAGLPPARALGQGAGLCAVLTDRTARCWGYVQHHQFPGPQEAVAPAPVALTGLAGVDELGLSQFVGSCARTAGRVACWGGEGSTAYRPTSLRGVANVTQLAVGEYHSCALVGSGRVSCWGYNNAGQLGRGATNHERDFGAGPVPGVDDAVEVRVGGGEPAAGAGSTCVRNAAGEVRCWGMINGQNRPTRVDLSTPAVAR